MRSRAAAAVLVLVSALLVTGRPAQAATPLVVTFLAIGQGDAALYHGPCGEVGLVDADEGSAPEILAALDRIGARGRLVWMAVSHYDADHLGDIRDVGTAPGVAVQAVYDRGGGRSVKDSATYRSYFDWVTAAGLRRSIDIGHTFTLCSGPETVSFRVVSAGTDGTGALGVAVSEENDRGVCLEVSYIRFDLATCGDVNGTDEGSRTDVETAVAGAFADVEVAKVNHHGSRFSSNPTYVSTLSAQVAVISVGANSFGHPDPAVVARWDGFGDVYQTGSPSGGLVDGDVHVETDGNNTFSVRGGASARTATFSLDAFPSLQRVSGADRFETAAAVSRATFPPGVATAYVTTGENFPDALAAGPAAAPGGPVLLVARSAIPPATAAELRRLAPARIVVVGGTAVVGGEVEAALSGFAGEVTRVAGDDRFGTAAAVSGARFGAGVPVVYVATGGNFPDALAGGAAAAAGGGPILLVERDRVPDTTKTELGRLKPGRIVVLGGHQAVSAAVESDLGRYSTGGVSRLAGEDRFATAEAVSAATFAAPGPAVYLPTGLNFPDALAATPAAARHGGALLLVRPECVPQPTVRELSRLTPARQVVVGGIGSVGEGPERMVSCG